MEKIKLFLVDKVDIKTFYKLLKITDHQWIKQQ